MVEERDLAGLRAYASELQEQFRKIRGGIADMQKEMNAVTATAKSADGYVTATVGPRGQVLKLVLDPRVYRKPDATKLAETITDTLRKAAQAAAKQVEVVSGKYAPGQDVGAYLRGDVQSRFGKFDFVEDQVTEGNER